MKENKFILTGNAPYDNRGCEAITRGTIKILDQTFGENNKYILESFYSTHEDYKRQLEREYDDRIKHFEVTYMNQRSLSEKLAPIAFLDKLSRKFDLYGHFEDINRKKKFHSHILEHMNDCKAVLCVGGDNYSLDYTAIPRNFTDTDDVILSYNKPCVIWGASIGPFSKLPKYEQFMAKHLNQITAIFAREDNTVEYLEQIGVHKNVYRVSDPAFLMEPKKPKSFENVDDFKFLEESIGINISSLMARYWTNGNLKEWTQFCVNLVKKVAEVTKRPIYLVPHVNISNPEEGHINNDYIFLKTIKENLGKTTANVYLIGPEYSAEELKYLISKMKGFIGARTHATIAAFSSHVPTISLAYSVKALGINKEIYGDLSYCVTKDKLNEVNYIADLINSAIIDQESIKAKMAQNTEKIKKRSLDAGILLKNIVS